MKQQVSHTNDKIFAVIGFLLVAWICLIIVFFSSVIFDWYQRTAVSPQNPAPFKNSASLHSILPVFFQATDPGKYNKKPWQEHILLVHSPKIQLLGDQPQNSFHQTGCVNKLKVHKQ